MGALQGGKRATTHQRSAVLSVVLIVPSRSRRLIVADYDGVISEKFIGRYDELEILSLERGRSPIYNWVESWAIVFVSLSHSFSLSPPGSLLPASTLCVCVCVYLSLFLSLFLSLLLTVTTFSIPTSLGDQDPPVRESECRLERNHTPDARPVEPSGSFQASPATREQSAESSE